MADNFFTFHESFLQVGDVITKQDGRKYLVIEQNINHYRRRRFLRPSEILKVYVTHLIEVNYGRRTTAK